jgi:hypothetical protein
MNRYTVDTIADIDQVRDALVKHLTTRLGYAVYISEVPRPPLPQRRSAARQMVDFLVAVALVYAISQLMIAAARFAWRFMPPP